MAKRLKIEGLVQGVGYRASFADKAVALGLRGWVCNRRDGSVEACVDGDAAAMDAIIAWAKQGPPFSRVDIVVVDASDAISNEPFKILPTQ
jgi:acylphosphatase